MWPLIEAAIALPPNTAADTLANAIGNYLNTHPPQPPTWEDLDKPDVIAAGADQTAARNAIGAVAKQATELDLREWVTTLPNDGETDCSATFYGIFDDLADLYTSTGQVHLLKVPAGQYLFDDWTIPPRSGVGVRGEGMYATTFLTAPHSSFIGRAWQDGDPDFIHENMVFEDFTVDGSRQPDGASYNSSLKAFVIQNARNVWFRNVRAMNTHATGFGVDYSDLVFFLHCVADNCGRGRKAHNPDVATRVGSGSGFGIGYGLHRDEHVEALDCHARNNGAAGFFAERLGRPEAEHHSSGLIVIGGVAEDNACGINDDGSNGSRFVGVTLRNNLYAGLRSGMSVAFEPGGRNGIAADLTIYGNANGVLFEGNAGQTYDVHDCDISENTGHGVWLRDGTNVWHGRNLRFHDNHIHRNGGAGVLANSAAMVPDLEIVDNYLHDNGQNAAATYRDEVCFVSPMARPRVLRNRIRSFRGYALAFRGSVISAEPQVRENDFGGSAGGALLNEHTITDQAGIARNLGDKALAVANLVPQPTPPSSGSNWSGSVATRTRQTGGPTIEGVAADAHIQGVATGSTPLIWGPNATVTPGDVIVASIYAQAPSEATGTDMPALIRPAVRFNDTGENLGPLVLASGDWERLDMIIVVPPGATTARVGARGTLWATGDILRATGANITKGTHLWPYIAGGQPNSSWDGTAGISTSKLAIPGRLIVDDDTLGADVTVGEATMSRDAVTSSGVTAGASGTSRLVYLTAKKTEQISKVRTISGGVALPADATLAKVGVHEVADNGDMTLVALTANEEATLWAATTTAYESTFLAPFTTVRGKRYAIEYLWVGPTAGVTYTGQNALTSSEQAVAPRLSGTVSGQSDIASTRTAGSIGNIASRMYAVLLP